MIRGNTLGPLFALLYAASFWGFIWYPVRLLEDMGMAGLWQTLVSYGAPLILMVSLRGLPLKSLAGHQRDAFWLALSSGWTNVAFLLAVLDGEVVRVLILFYMSPLWAILLGRWLLGEPIRRHTGIMLLLGLAGTVTMLWRPGALQVEVGMADWLAMSAGFTFALTNVMTRRMRAASDQIKTQLAWIGVVVISSLGLVTQSIPLPAVSLAGWVGAILLGIVGFLSATLAVVFAVSRMPIQRSSVIMLFEIVVGALSAWLLAGEALSWREWLGGAMVVGAGLVAVLCGDVDGA